MARSPYKPRELFLEVFPDPLLRAICEQIMLAYQDSHQYCTENYDQEEAHDLFPKERRAMVERNVNHIVRQFSYASAEPATNRTGGAYHQRIQSGCVLLTISAVSSRLQMVRSARFREQYARDPQRKLFGPEDPPPVQATLFALLLHVPHKKVHTLPAHLTVAFPDADCKNYIDSIDLYGRFDDLLVPQTPETPMPKPRLRPMVKPQEDE